jgi:hypothetical protein
MPSLLDFPDLKYIRLHHEDQTIAAAGINTFTFVVDQGKLVFLSMITIKSDAATLNQLKNLDGVGSAIKIDGQAMGTVEDPFTNILGYITTPFITLTTTVPQLQPDNVIPSRKSVQITTKNNNVGLATHTVEMFGWVTEDRDGLFTAAATHKQGGN